MKRILFVDDETSLLDGLRRLLRPQRARWEAMFAAGGEEALRMLDDSPVDVVVTDMRMPGMDGAELLKRVRARFPGVVRIVLSGYCDMESTLRAVTVAHQFLQKPCDAKKLVQAIDRACGLTDALPDESIRRVVGAIGELPCLPRTSAALMQALDDPEVPVIRLGQIAEQDVGISAKVMQLVNSAFFGRSQEVWTIPRAVTYLGAEVLKQLVVTAEVFRAFQPAKRIEGFSLAAIQKHSHLAAAIAARFPLSKVEIPMATVAALLHDTGKLVLASRLPEQFEQICRLAIGESLTFHAAEERLLGTTHAEIGSYLLGLWGLPAAIVLAVARHHRPIVGQGGDTHFDVPAAVYFAEILASERAPVFGFRSYEIPSIDQEYVRALGVESELAAWRANAEAAEVS